MDIEEIVNYIKMGKAKSICIDRIILNEYSGFVRDLIIMDKMIVKVEFNVYGYDVGGFSIKIYYSDFDLLINSIEDYTGKKVAEWMNVTKNNWYPDLKQKNDFDQSGLKFKRDLAEKKLNLPKGGISYVIPEGYWKDLYEGLEKW